MAAGDNQKLKMLYLVKIFSEETDDSHALSLQEIVDRLEAYGVNAERKTLYKDFGELEKFGLEILSEQSGRNVLYHLATRRFELPELKLRISRQHLRGPAPPAAGADHRAHQGHE